MATGTTPHSTLSLLVQLGLWVQLALGSQVYWTPLIFLTLCGIFLSGCFLAIRNSRSAVDRWIMAFVILMGAAFGFYFKSFYQQAMTLALLPWFFGGMLALRDGRPTILFVTTCLLLGSMIENIFFAPIALAAFVLYRYPRKALWVSASLLAVAAMIAFSFNIEQNGLWVPNSYNRYYNGLGWTSMGITKVPHRTWRGLQLYFYSTLPKSLQNPKSIPPNAVSLMGTSYWPTGSRLSAIAAAGSEADKTRLQDILRRGKLIPFLDYFVRHPGSIPGYLWSPPVVAIRLNYDLSYIRAPFIKPVNPLPIVTRVDKLFLSHLGFLYTALFALALIVSALRRNLIAAIISGYYFIGAPIFCVFGDGYYEIEKHLASLWFFAPVILYMCITDFERRTIGSTTD